MAADKTAKLLGIITGNVNYILRLASLVYQGLDAEVAFHCFNKPENF